MRRHGLEDDVHVRLRNSDEAVAKGIAPVLLASGEFEALAQAMDRRRDAGAPIHLAAEGLEAAAHIGLIHAFVADDADRGEGLAFLGAAESDGRRVTGDAVARMQA